MKFPNQKKVKDMDFEDEVRKIVEMECENYFFGIVDLSLQNNSTIKRFKSLISEYPRAFSIGITLPYRMSYEMLMREGKAVYRETNCQLRNITANISSTLENAGYNALSLPKEVTNQGRSISLHELIANLANLGWIENGSLVTKEEGTAVNWGTVLTDAPIE